MANPYFSITVFVLLGCSAGCGDFRPRAGHSPSNTEAVRNSEAEPDRSGTDAGAASAAGAGNNAPQGKESDATDTRGLDALIAQRLEPTDTAAALHGRPGLSAQDNWNIAPSKCLEQLKSADVAFSEPDFDTPLVQTPILIEGPINGVLVKPKWPGKDRTHEVMDCHLALALVDLTKRASALGLDQVLFYSTYRPVKALSQHCEKGVKGAQCRKKLEKYRRRKKGLPSKHALALAIDIRWFVTKAGETIDVREHFDRRGKSPPCSYEASTESGRLLLDLLCALHREKIFNVMLTPNANRAHRDHFHFDITPDASWYILR